MHPNITDNIDYYRKGNLYILLEYDGCGLRNRNGFNKRTDYSRGHQCVLPTSKPDWRRTKEKSKIQRVYFTRYQTQHNNRYLATVKGNYYYNHRKKEYIHNNLWRQKIGFKWLVHVYTSKIQVVTELKTEPEK